MMSDCFNDKLFISLCCGVALILEYLDTSL